MANSFRRSHARTATLSSPDPVVGYCQSTPPPETPGPSQASLGQSLVGSLLLSSWVLVHTRFCLYPLRICFPSPVLSSIIKSTGLQSQILWEFSIPLPDPQVGKSVVDPRTFLTVWEFLWYNCSAFCRSSAQWLYGGVNGDLFQEGLWHRVCDSSPARAPALAVGHC